MLGGFPFTLSVQPHAQVPFTEARPLLNFTVFDKLYSSGSSFLL